MKIKKTLALIMATALTVGTMAGCSQTTLNYAKELSNTAKWEATTSNIDGDINVDVTGKDGKEEKQEIKFTASGYQANDKSYVDMQFTDPSGKLNIPELKAYCDGTTAYVNKSFYEGMYSMEGKAVPAGFSSISQEYIAVDSASDPKIDASKIKALMSQPDAMVALGKMIFGENSGLDIPFVQNGREYTLNLDADKTVDLAANAVKAAGNNVDNINNTFKLGLKADEISQIKTAVNSTEFNTKLADVKTILAGTTITSKEVFADTSYNSDFNMNLKIKDFGNISLTMKSTATKTDVKSISFPTSTIKLTGEEFAKLENPTSSIIEATTANTLKEQLQMQ